MKCRDASVADAAAIARVSVDAWRAAYQELMPAAYLGSLDAALAAPAFEQSLRDGLATLVAERDGEIIGFSAYGPSRDPDAGPGAGEVIAINIVPAAWRQGVGRELLQHTLQRLGQKRCTEVTLWVLHGNAKARRFYEDLGWTADGAEKRDDRLTGFTLHEIRYRMVLR